MAWSINGRCIFNSVYVDVLKTYLQTKKTLSTWADDGSGVLYFKNTNRKYFVFLICDRSSRDDDRGEVKNVSTSVLIDKTKSPSLDVVSFIGLSS